MNSRRSPSRQPRKRRGEAGATIVESALVLITMLGMILFIMDMGRMLLMQQYITERTRATVRAAVVNNWTATQVANFLVYNNITAPSGGGAGFLGLTTSEVSYSALGTAGTSDYRLQVQVSNVPMLTWIPFMAGSYTAPTVVATYSAQSLGATD